MHAASAPHIDGESVYFSLINRNKKSIALNLRDARAQAIVAELAAGADVVVENFRPGVARRLGVGHETLRALNPRLVYLSISGFGQTGPAAGQPVYDLIMQAMSGLMAITGAADGPPMAVGESIGDLWAGLFGSWSILAALQARTRTGEGDYIDLAMFDAMLSMQVTGLSQLHASGISPRRVGNRHPVTTPVDVFGTADGHVAIVVATQPSFMRLCEAMGDAALADDPRFKTGAARLAHEPVLRERIATWMAPLASADVVAACRARDIPAGMVGDLGNSLHSEQARARGVERRVPHPVFGEIGMVPQPAHFAHGQTASPMREPRIGEHGDVLLQSLLSRSDEEIESLRQAGVLR